jgi:hypothetical protein
MGNYVMLRVPYLLDLLRIETELNKNTEKDYEYGGVTKQFIRKRSILSPFPSFKY